MAKGMAMGHGRYKCGVEHHPHVGFRKEATNEAVFSAALNIQNWGRSSEAQSTSSDSSCGECDMWGINCACSRGLARGLSDVAAWEGIRDCSVSHLLLYAILVRPMSLTIVKHLT